MKRTGRRAVKVWNGLICPAIEFVVGAVGLLGLFVAIPLTAVLLLGG